MGRVVDLIGRGGQRFAEHMLGWNRGTIRKGQAECRNGVWCKKPNEPYDIVIEQYYG